MPIRTFKGNLLDAKGIIVHGCNCQGVMGSGVALAIKERWPEAFRAYRRLWSTEGLSLGDIQVLNVAPDVMLVNAMTQQYYGRDGKRYVDYDAVSRAFDKVNDFAWRTNKPVNFPLIGCGLGGGDWSVVSSIIDSALDDGIDKILWVQ